MEALGANPNRDAAGLGAGDSRPIMLHSVPTPGIIGGSIRAALLP